MKCGSTLSRQSSPQRDTGIDGLYLGFFLLNRDPRVTCTRIVPLLLWPLKLQLEVGSRGQVALAFDGEREEVRLNPAPGKPARAASAGARSPTNCSLARAPPM